MTGSRRQIMDAVAATQIIDATTYGWFGVRAPGLAAAVQQSIDPQSARAYLVYSLQERLYTDFYCAGGARPTVADPMPYVSPGTSPFVESLSQANAGTGARDPGWTLVREDGQALVVARGGLSLWASPGLVYPATESGLRPGAAVGILMPKELLRLSPGFYMALGECEFPTDGSSPLVRFYWNLRSEGAVPLISLLTHGLNAARLAFRLKVASDPVRYSRCDAGVLYVRLSDYKRAITIVADAYSRIAPGLKPAIPALTRMLAPGLALAEDPGGQLESFGMSRCRMLAEGIVRASERGSSDPEQTLSIVGEVLAEAGVSVDAPYLNPGSADRYRFPL